MEEFKGTPGPWYHNFNTESKAIFHPTKIGERLALVDDTFTDTGLSVKANEEWKANVQLIASAPDLLELAMKAQSSYEKYGHLLNFDASSIKNVINKALGKEVTNV